MRAASAVKSSPTMAVFEILSAGAAGLSLSMFVLVALMPPLVGRELECFPALKKVLEALLGIGAWAFVAAAVIGFGLALTVVARKSPPTFGRLGGLAGAALVFALLATSLFGGPVRLVFGMSLGHNGPNCIPAGLLGSNPDLWHSFSRATGYTPKPAPSTWPFY